MTHFDEHLTNVAAARKEAKNARIDRDDIARDIAFRVAYGHPVPDALSAAYRSAAVAAMNAQQRVFDLYN